MKPSALHGDSSAEETGWAQSERQENIENREKQLVVWSSWNLKVEAGSDKRRGWNDRWRPLVRTGPQHFSAREWAARSDLSLWRMDLAVRPEVWIPVRWLVLRPRGGVEQKRWIGQPFRRVLRVPGLQATGTNSA